MPTCRTPIAASASRPCPSTGLLAIGTSDLGIQALIGCRRAPARTRAFMNGLPFPCGGLRAPGEGSPAVSRLRRRRELADLPHEPLSRYITAPCGGTVALMAPVVMPVVPVQR